MHCHFWLWSAVVTTSAVPAERVPALMETSVRHISKENLTGFSVNLGKGAKHELDEKRCKMTFLCESVCLFHELGEGVIV